MPTPSVQRSFGNFSELPRSTENLRLVLGAVVLVAVPVTLRPTVAAAMLAIVVRGIVVNVVPLRTMLVVILMAARIEDRTADNRGRCPGDGLTRRTFTYAGVISPRSPATRTAPRVDAEPLVSCRKLLLALVEAVQGLKSL
jgi:hypothetical protein